jgi:hypothetical protein
MKDWTSSDLAGVDLLVIQIKQNQIIVEMKAVDSMPGNRTINRILSSQIKVSTFGAKLHVEGRTGGGSLCRLSCL